MTSAVFDPVFKTKAAKNGGIVRCDKFYLDPGSLFDALLEQMRIGGFRLIETGE